MSASSAPVRGFTELLWTTLSHQPPRSSTPGRSREDEGRHRSRSSLPLPLRPGYCGSGGPADGHRALTLLCLLGRGRGDLPRYPPSPTQHASSLGLCVAANPPGVDCLCRGRHRQDHPDRRTCNPCHRGAQQSPRHCRALRTLCTSFLNIINQHQLLRFYRQRPWWCLQVRPPPPRASSLSSSKGTTAQLRGRTNRYPPTNNTPDLVTLYCFSRSCVERVCLA